MRARFLRLLLILALISNGTGVPAAAAMDVHAGHAAMQALADAEAPDAHAHHGAPAPAGEERNGECCGDGSCGCGCVLPPMLARAAQTVEARRWSAAPEAVLRRPILSHRDAPLLRPPAA